MSREYNNEYLRRIAESITGSAIDIEVARTQADDGVTITVGGAGGTSTATVYDGPTGATGPTGPQGPQGPSGYVLTETDKVDIAGRVRPTVVSETAPTTLTLADNTEYYLTDVDDLTITYPSGSFDCWLRISTVATGEVTVSMPTSQFVGALPTFAAGETWELSIRDGVIVAGKVES